MPEISSLLTQFYEFIVHGLTEYFFIFNVHYILAFIVVTIGIKYTRNLDWYKSLFGKHKKYIIPITGLFLLIGYLFLGTNGLNVAAFSSLIQSYLLMLVFQDIFIVIFGLLINKVSFNHIKFDHNDKSIKYVSFTKKSEDVELNKGEDYSESFETKK
jgi:hypothetical protein